MILPCVSVALLPAAALCSIPTKVRVFILAGQSNMEGQAVVDLDGPDYNQGRGTLEALLADPMKSDMVQHLRQPNGKWLVRDDVWVRYQREGQPLLKGPLSLGFSVYGDQHHFGPELQFGHEVGTYFKEPVLLIKAAWGGKSLYRDFRPPSSGGKVGEYYRLMVAQVHDALANLDKEFPSLKGRGYELAGFVWYHGWNDGVEPKTAVPEYEQNLVNLIKDVRREFNTPKLPVVIGEITGPWVKAEGAWDALRKAQAAAAKRPELAGNVLFVPTHDFVRKPEDSPNPSHGHHEFGNAETYFLVGGALGKAMVRLVEAQTFPALKDYGLRAYTHLSIALPHSENKTWKLVCILPYNCHFQPWIELDAKAGQVLLFNSTNPLVQYLTKTESYTTKSGIQCTQAENWVSGEGAIYTIPAGVTVKGVKYRETGFDTSFAGSFECNDNDYNILWKKAARTAYVCMRDHFYDCPDRERVGFWGDGTPELNQCFYVFDSKAHRLAKDLVRRPLEPKFYPGQHLEFLGDYGLWFYYLHSGDLDSIRAVYEQTKSFLFDTYQFGNKGTWFDWGKEVKDTAVIETCFYYNCLGTLRKMAVATDHRGDLPQIDQRLEEIAATFDAKYWKNGFYMSSQVTTPDDRANAMAVNVGLASPTKWQAIYDNVLSNTENSSCFFDRWVFEALCKMDKPDRALLRMYSRYRTMIPASFTTLWEHYDRWWASHIDAFDDASSLNHGWNPPALILSQNIAGVRPLRPGWSVFQVLPQEAFLKVLNVCVPSIKGNIVLRIEKTAKSYRLTADSPMDTSAILGIPKRSFSRLDSISAKGKVIWQGRFRGGVEGLSWAGEDDRYVKFRVKPGLWELLAQGALPTSSPKPLPKPKRKEIALDKRFWVASASVPNSSFLFSGDKIPIDISAENAIDGDHWTGWRDMTRTQYPGQWFQVDMKRKQSFDKIVLDNTWALWDTPQQYIVQVSEDGSRWSEPIAKGRGELGITTITFPLRQARWIRISQTAANKTYHWSIYEMDVYRGIP